MFNFLDYLFIGVLIVIILMQELENKEKLPTHVILVSILAWPLIIPCRILKWFGILKPIPDPTKDNEDL